MSTRLMESAARESPVRRDSRRVVFGPLATQQPFWSIDERINL